MSETLILSENTSVLTYEIGFGMSECSPTVMLQTTLDSEDHIGTVGKPVSGTYVYFSNR